MFEKPMMRELFRKPNIQSEVGEFKRTGLKFNIDDSVLMYQAENNGILIPLTDDLWRSLDNTNSYQIKRGDHEAASELATSVGRDYKAVSEEMYVQPVDAPIIIKFGNKLYLIAGNTRLMASRAYGVTPNVWLFEVDDNEEIS